MKLISRMGLGWKTAFALALIVIAAFAPLYAVAATVSSSTFDSDANGWAISLWHNGADNGTLAWTSGAGSPGGAVEMIGYGMTDNTDKCTREGGEITKTISTVGYSSIGVSYDLRVSALGGSFTGAGTGSSCPIDHNLIDEQLTVSYSVDEGSTWTEAENLLRAALLAGYQSYGTRTLNLSSVTAANNNANFMLKFRWQVNSPVDICDLDNITVTGTSPDTTPPGNVTGFTATPGAGQMGLSWTNPSDSDFAGTKIMFKTTGYPSGPTDGSQVYNGTGTNSLHTGLTGGITYYYTAFSFDASSNYASGSQASGVPSAAPPANVSGFTAVPGNTQVSLSWINPGGSFTGTKIMFKTTGYPTGPTDGSQIYDSSGVSYMHTGLTNGTTYYYTAFAHDGTPLYASGTQTSVIPGNSVPSFGGSISPSVTNSLTPAVTITAQDTGVGLNVGSGEFAYSLDGGTSFVSYIGRYVLHSVGTGSGSGNQWWYPDFYHPNYTIASGDHLQYDIYSNNTDGTGAVDIEGSFGNLRDSGILDQNALSGHPAANISSHDYHQWYHRDFDLSSKAGQVIAAYEMAHETDNGVSEYYVRNVIITNNGVVKDRAADADAWTPVSETVAPGNNGYSSTVGPEMLTSDPASPAMCTGSNGTTAQQTVTAAFSSNVTPLLAGANNRIKFRISNAGGSRSVSSTFNLTVDQAAPTCTIGSPSVSSLCTGGSFSYPVTYADTGGSGLASVNLTTSMVHVSTLSGTASATISSVTNGTTATPTVNLTNAAGSGTLRITVDGGAAADGAGNLDLGAAAGANVAVSSGDVTGFTASPGNAQNSLSWSVPGCGGFTGVKIVFKTTGYPSGPNDGTQIYDSNGTSYAHASLTNGTTYYYAAYAHDSVPNYTSGAQASATPSSGPPANVSGFSAIVGSAQISLSWTNPGGSFAGARIMVKTTGYPTGPNDGTLIYDSNGTSYTHTGLTNGTVYYYTVFAHDGIPNYASGAQVSAAPTAAQGLSPMSIHSSRRYYQDSNGKPVFLIGYYDWAPLPTGDTTGNGGAQYINMIRNGGPYGCNYIRVTLGANNAGPPNYAGHTFVQMSNGKYHWADTTTIPNNIAWDPVFWNGLHDICQAAQDNGVIVNVCFFDGVELRGGQWYGYENAPWNPGLHDQTYWPSGSYGDCGGCFYRASDFVNNTGIGYYQRALIDKAIATTADFNNVMFEIGNELGSSDTAWNTAVIAYVNSKTSKPIEQCEGGIASNVQGLSDHQPTSAVSVKTIIAPMVGNGYPTWQDPDNDSWPGVWGIDTCGGNCTSAYAAQDTGQRQSAWYSLTGGAACWGGFTEDYWNWPNPVVRGFSLTMGQYNLNLQNFLKDSSVAFWAMTPQHGLVSNGSSTNSCIANPGVEYVAYIVSDATATLDLTAVSGNASYQLYDPVAGTYTAQQTVAGGAVRTFNKPTGASDWVIHVYTGVPAALQTLNVKTAGTITIDGSSSDWSLSDFTTKVRGGQGGTGDIAWTGWDGSGIYYAGRNTSTVLPTGQTDHTVRVYCRHDASYLYFLARCDDSDIRYSAATSSNWSNDCVEIYIDPSHTGGPAPLTSSTSDVRLVIDANNQVNVYSCTPSYTSQVLAGVTSAVVRDGTGWWMEARVAKNALSPAIPGSGSIGLDFAFRDNDNNNDTTQTTVYDWADRYSGTTFPSQIPDHWGVAFMSAIGETPYPGPNPAGVPGIIQAENYDNGGEGVAYHDTTPGNSGGVYRSDDVDIQACSDSGFGYNLFNITTGEWLAYTVSVATSGNYDLKMRVASASVGSFHIEANGQNVSGTKSIAASGGGQNWTVVTVPSVHLNSGQQIIKVVSEVGGWTFNYLDIENAVTPVACGWNAVRPAVNMGIGQFPAVGVDSVGNVHTVFGSGTTIQYRKYDRNLVLLASETIPAPNGNGDWTWPDIEIDENDVPHVSFSQHIYPDANTVWYTNRIGGVWKTPTVVINGAGVGVVVYPRLEYCGGYCYANSMIWGNPAAYIVRITNLSGTPTVDRTAGVPFWATMSVNKSNCHVYACGRNGAAGHYFQEYDSNLNPIGGSYEVSVCKTGKTNKASGMYGDKNGVVHMVMDCVNNGGSGGNQMLYNNTSRRNGDGSFQCGIQGLQSTGPNPDGGPTGWWNDDVWEEVTLDATGTVYVAYREFSPAGTGLFTKVSAGGFTEPPTAFAPTIQKQQEYNCSIAPAKYGGIYVVYYLGTFAYIQGIGTGCWTPGPITGLSATPGNAQVALSWVNPGDPSFAGVKIVAKTSGYPTGPTDGTLVYNGNGTNGVHSGLVNGVTYYYAAYAYDSTPNYSSAAQTAATPHALADWINETFDNYNNGGLTGQGGWSGVGNTAQVQSAQAKGGTGKAASFDAAVLGSGSNNITFTDKTTGSILVDFDVAQDTAGTAGAEVAYVSVYGADSSMEIMRLHIQKGRIFAEYGPSDPGTLVVMSTTVSNLTWNNVRLGFNIDTKTIDLWLDGASKGTGYAWKTGATRVSRVVIGCDRNASLTTQKCYFDNLRVEPKPGQVTAVTDDGSWSPSLSKLHFTFPAVAGTPEYQYAIGTTSGGTQTRGWTSCGTSTDVLATGLSLTENTTTYYVSVQCLTQYGTAGTSRTSNGIKVGVGVAKIKDAKALADGTSSQVKALRGKLVSAPFTGYFYIQEPGEPSGIKVVSTASVNTGDLVDVCGVMKGSGAERYMDGTGNGVIKTTPAPGGPNPVSLGHKAMGGTTLNANTPGVVGGLGLNNIGLYAVTFGKVTQRSTAAGYFYIDDGSGLSDGTTTDGVANVGVRVIADPTTYPAGAYVSVTGVVSCFNSSGLRPQILPQTIQLLKAP